MTERRIAYDYMIRGQAYEIWVDRFRNWYIAKDGKDVDSSKLTEGEREQISNLVDDLLRPG